MIVLTDSDDAGKQIREKLNAYIKRPINIEVNILKCNKKGKHGIAECDKKEIINALKEHFTDNHPAKIIDAATINSSNINKEKREMLCKKLELGKCNNKTFIKRLNYLKYTKEELEKYGD